MNRTQRPESDAATGASGRRLVLPNRYSELARVSEWLQDFARESHLEHELAQGLEVAVNEALTNIISYAYRDGARHDIIVDLFAQGDRISVDIEDDGVPFNPLEHDAGEPSPQSLEEARPGGRGILLMRNFTHELRYVRRDGRNRLTLVLTF